MVTRKTSIIPKAAVVRILIKAGAKRVSDSAASVFSEVIQIIAEEIAEKANKIAIHSGRKTVQDGDIRLAVRQ